MTYCLYARPVNHISLEYLKSLFQEFGEVEDVYIPRMFKTKRRRHFGYVKFNDKHAAARAIEGLDNKEINGRIFSVKWSEHTSKTPEQMVEMRERRIAEKENRPKKYTEEEFDFLQKTKLKKEGSFFERYFTAVDYPKGVGEEFTPIYQLNLPPVGERKTFFSWVYIPPERIEKIKADHLMREKARTKHLASLPQTQNS